MAFYKCARIYVTENSNTEINTTSGPIANFNTLLATPLLSLKANFKAIQDLHGQSGPYPAGGSAQIWDEEWEKGYLSSTDGSFISHISSVCSKNFNSVEPNTSYFIYVGSGVPSSYIYWYDNNETFISRDYVGSSGSSLTSPSNSKYLKFSCYGYGGDYKNNVSINYPSTDTAYHPYSNICPISGITGINLYHSKKNVFNPELCVLENYYEVNSDGTIKVLASNAKTWDTLPEIPIKAGTYTVSKTVAGGRLTIRTALSNYESNAVALLDGQTSASFTIAEDTKFRIKIMTSYSSYPVDVGIMIELGSTATSFEAFNGSTTLINLGGTYYGGYVKQDKDGKRELVVTHGDSVDLNTLTFYRATFSGNNGFYADLPNGLIKGTGSATIDGLCTNYKVTSQASMPEDKSCRFYSHTDWGGFSRIAIRDDDTIDMTGEEFTAYVTGKICYEIQNPQTIALPDGERIKSFAGINNIYTDTGDTTIEYRNLTQGG